MRYPLMAIRCGQPFSYILTRTTANNNDLQPEHSADAFRLLGSS